MRFKAQLKKKLFSKKEFNTLLDLAEAGIKDLIQLQRNHRVAVKDFQLRFIKLAIESKALQFGDLPKSGRSSPYFQYNASTLLSFGHISELSEILLLKTKDLNIKFDMIFGPAYKGIFLGSLLAAELSKKSSMPVCFNRKRLRIMAKVAH